MTSAVVVVDDVDVVDEVGSTVVVVVGAGEVEDVGSPHETFSSDGFGLAQLHSPAGDGGTAPEQQLLTDNAHIGSSSGHNAVCVHVQVAPSEDGSHVVDVVVVSHDDQSQSPGSHWPPTPAHSHGLEQATSP